MEHKIPRVAIVNSTPFCSYDGVNYLAPSELTSLSQWFPLFGETVLLKPQLSALVPPKGWRPLSGKIRVVPLSYSRDGRLQRRTNTLRTAQKALEGIDVLYARMPNYEGFWVFRIARRMGIPLLLELHGDWTSAVMEEDRQGLLRRVTRRLRANQADNAIRCMSGYASAVITIGPRLKEKYAPPTKPVLVCTNHLLPISMYCPRVDFSLESPPLLLFVGDLQRRKGLLVLFSALGKLKSRGYSFQMVLVGDGSSLN